MRKSGIDRQAMIAAAINGFIVVALGAFGAHVFEQHLSANMLEVFETGVRYHMFHVAALIGTAFMAGIKPAPGRLSLCLWLFVAGIVLFSGSLYLLALTGQTWLGMVTPLGGLAFLAGWTLLFTEALSLGEE